MKEIKIVYCVPCGYIGFADQLKKTIETKVKKTKVNLEGGEHGVLDIFVDDKLVFSKHKEGRRPEVSEVLELVKNG